MDNQRDCVNKKAPVKTRASINATTVFLTPVVVRCASAKGRLASSMDGIRGR